MKKLIIWLFFLCNTYPIVAQKENFTYKFYGFVRGDLFYNTRANMAPVDGNFYLFPLDINPDSEGKDLNSKPNGSFYTFTSRLGIDAGGPKIGQARSSAKIEVDFGGFSSSNTMLRIRQAYVALDWTNRRVLIGQTWHPLFGQVMPDMMNLSTGAPFQPFNRSPQLRFERQYKKLKLTAAALWQLQYLSSGPNGMSEEYIKNSCVPELFIGADYAFSKEWIAGGGIHFISIKPRTQTIWNDKTYKVNERITTASYEVHGKYKGKKFCFASKTILASMLDHTALLGGYGIYAINPENGAQEYTPFRHSTSWVNLTYGTKWKGHLFAGFTKNLGTTEPLIETKVYGMGLNIDKLLTLNAAVSYNLPHWTLGFELSPASAWYGSLERSTGKIVDTHRVTNYRMVGMMTYYF